MKKNIIIVAAALLVIILCADLSAQTSRRIYEKVTPRGTETVTVQGNLPLSSNSTMSAMNTIKGLIWNYPDNGLYWIAGNVSIGNYGTQVLGVMELNNEQVELFSVFDGNPPTAVWTDASIYGTDAGYMCDSSAQGDCHVVMYHENAPDIMNRIPHVNCYNSSSSTPDWTWSYPSTINAATRVSIDRDATVVTIGVYNNNTGMLDLFFLDPDTGAEISTFSQSAPSGLRGWDLSADGSTLYFHGGSTCYIFDIATLTVVFSASTGGSFDGHCISGDGTKFANGSFGKVKIWEYISGSWSSYTYSTGSGNYGDEMDFSDDGSTLGFGVTRYTPSSNKTEAYIMDVATKTITAHVVNNSNGVYSDVCSAASISHDGRYFVLGRWGDQANANPEVQILENNAGLLDSIDCRGSCYDADISWDGQITVIGAKAVHAGVFGKGGDLYCHTIGGEDMEFTGTPGIGAGIQIDVYTNPNWQYWIWLGTGIDPEGYNTFKFGTLYLDPTPPNLFYTTLFPILTADGAGVGTITGTIPNNPVYIGMTIFLQTLFSDGSPSFELSDDFLTVTILP